MVTCTLSPRLQPFTGIHLWKIMTWLGYTADWPIPTYFQAMYSLERIWTNRSLCWIKRILQTIVRKHRWKPSKQPWNYSKKSLSITMVAEPSIFFTSLDVSKVVSARKALNQSGQVPLSRKAYTCLTNLACFRSPMSVRLLIVSWSNSWPTLATSFCSPPWWSWFASTILSNWRSCTKCRSRSRRKVTVVRGRTLCCSRAKRGKACV